jgi:hypothetical protein
MSAIRRDSRFGVALKATLWLAGLLIALMVGALSAYVILSGVYFASQAYARLAPGNEESPEA